MIPKALTIAGSDPSGGAGIQADLKTFSRLRVYGMSVITAVTVQDTTGVFAVSEIAADLVASQLKAVMTDIPPDAVKTGMLATAPIVEASAAKIQEYGVTQLVVDPVMVSSSGRPLLEADAIRLLKRELLPLAVLVTPNAAEAETLTGKAVRSLEAMEEAARAIHDCGPQGVLIKGGHITGNATDVFFDGERIVHLEAERLHTPERHGTGCVLSAAITAYLARGEPLYQAAVLGKDFVTESIRHGLDVGRGHPPCDPLGLADG